MAARRHPCWAAEEAGHARRGRLRRRDQAAPRARGRARRAERAPPGHARGEEPRPGRRRPREAVAPEGHRPRPPGHDPRAAVHGRRRRVPADAARLHGQGQPKALKAALRCALSRPRAGRHARARSTAPRSTRRRRSGASTARGRGARRRRPSSSSTEDEESALEVVPQPRPRARHRSVGARGRARRVGALAARQRGRARRSCRGGPRHEPASDRVLITPVVSEKSYEQIAQQPVHVPGAPGRAQDADPPGRRAALRRQGRAREHRQGAGEAEAPRPLQAARGRAGRRPSSSCSAGDTIEIFEGAQL